MKSLRNSLLVCALFVTAALADGISVEQLDARCEAARQVKIRPLREAEIAKCKAEKRSDPQYCERFWKDYGEGGRNINGAVRPRLFDDLPECVAAHEARSHSGRR